MNQATTASLANTLAIKQVHSEIKRLNLLRALIGWVPGTPDYHTLILVRLDWLKVLHAREPWLGVGARKRLRGAA